jgi:hypothetical protein
MGLSYAEPSEREAGPIALCTRTRFRGKNFDPTLERSGAAAELVKAASG